MSFGALLADVFAAIALAGAAYQLVALREVRRFARTVRDFAPPRDLPPASLLKPLCGEDADLAANLESFCRQDHPVQLVFGCQDPGDPALGVVRALQARHPEADIAVVSNGRRTALNGKVGNLIEMRPAARHARLIVSDSDMRVGPDYARRVLGPLEAPGTGLVTCLYVGRGTGLWSGLGAAYINYGFFPAALVGRALAGRHDCFGATMALHAETLGRIGGFEAFADELADDYALGRAVAGLGLDVALAPVVVETIVAEPDFGALLRHELRWARTIRRAAPLGHAASASMHPVPWATFALLTAAFSASGFVVPLAALGLALLSRGLLVRTVDRNFGLAGPSWGLLILRDWLSFLVLLASFCGRRVTWRNRRFRVEADGRLVAERD